MDSSSQLSNNSVSISCYVNIFADQCPCSDLRQCLSEATVRSSIFTGLLTLIFLTLRHGIHVLKVHRLHYRALKSHFDMPINKVFFHPYTIMLFRWRDTPFTVNPTLRLPQELVEEIILYLDDAASLLACSIVCFAWVPASRRRICLNISTHARATELHSLLRSPYETFTANITKFLLAEREPASENNDLDPMAQYHRILCFLTLKGVNLQHATIDEKPLLAKILFAYFPDVPALSFIFLPPPAIIPVNHETECLNLLRMLQSFPQVHSLSLILKEGWRWDVNIPDLKCASGGSLDIAVLHLTGAWNPSLMIWRGLVTLQGRQSRPLTTNARPHVMIEFVTMPDTPDVLKLIEWNWVRSSSRPSSLNVSST